MPNAISADGLTIVGDGTDPDGNTQAWRVHSPVPFSAVPEPSGSLLGLAALAAIALTRRAGRNRAAGAR